MSTEKENLITLSTQEQQTENEENDTLITTLPTKMQRFIHLYMTGQYTNAKLAQLLEVHPNTIGHWLKRKDVRSIIEDMQQTTHDVVSMQLKNLTLKAVNKLGALTDSPIDGVALQAVKDILDRAGHKSKQEIKIDKTVTTYEQKLSNLINETIIDAEIVEVEE